MNELFDQWQRHSLIIARQFTPTIRPRRFGRQFARICDNIEADNLFISPGCTPSCHYPVIIRGFATAPSCQRMKFTALCCCQDCVYRYTDPRRWCNRTKENAEHTDGRSSYLVWVQVLVQTLIQAQVLYQFKPHWSEFDLTRDQQFEPKCFFFKFPKGSKIESA